MSAFEVLENPVRDTIIRTFLEKKVIINYNEIKQLVGQDTSRPDYHLNILVESGLLERTRGRGNYELKKEMIQPLRKKYDILVPICLLGGLIDINLYANILDGLKEEVSIIPKKYFILTSPNIKEKFEKEAEKHNLTQKYGVEPLFELFEYDSELKGDISKIRTQAEMVIKKNIFEYEIICDLTGGTKLVTIALSKLSEDYNLRKILFTGEHIKWL
ncbi:MAG: hypothetical protein BAJALOKI1v1_1160003 [Promethearchaeota archaeon]|nr:MAG: hypothetical protein BAJALOKI1v1_1160003 [Candidatus Lokiarchaeota archaeon]